MEEKTVTGFDKVDKALLKVVKIISVGSAASLVGIMLVAFFNVIIEKTMHRSIPASTEIIQYLHVPVVFLAAAYVTLDQGHTRIDLLSKHLPKAIEKACLTLGDLIGCGVCAFVGYMGLCRMRDAIGVHLKSSTSGVGFSLWPFILIFSVGFFMLSVTFLWSIVRRYSRPEPPVNISVAPRGPADPTDEIRGGDQS